MFNSIRNKWRRWRQRRWWSRWLKANPHEMLCLTNSSVHDYEETANVPE